MNADLDIERPGELLTYLREQGRIAPDEVPQFQVLGGGVSNRAVLTERPNGEAWVVKQALAKLRVPTDWFSSPARIAREALGLRWLIRLAPPGATVPLVFEDDENHILAMAAVPQPHDNWKTLLLAGRLDTDHVAQFGALLGTIHRNAAGDATVARDFADRSFYDSLRLDPYYRYTATQVREAAPFIGALLAETWSTQLTLVHGDYSPKNILVHGGRLILLDHEVVHYGDPAFDLGFGLTHLLSKAHHLPAHRAAFAAAAALFWQSYGDALGTPPWLPALEGRAVRHTLACLLARVAGRSPLEYLDAAERARQRAVVVELMRDPPTELGGEEGLVTRFVSGVSYPLP
ncbi:MAG TPA: aminoglycoside phosphotransferase family protein [Thermomicrobiales bacterium]|jgi:aminoglycoside phosphotransferase (APT) family kinase protein